MAAKRSAAAAGLPAPAALKAAADLESGCTCAICLDIFEVPVVAACSHSFCRSCLLEHATDDGKQCPLCAGTLCPAPLPMLVLPGGLANRLQTAIIALPEIHSFRGMCDAARTAELQPMLSATAAARLLRLLRGSWKSVEARVDGTRMNSLSIAVTTKADADLKDTRGRSLTAWAAITSRMFSINLAFNPFYRMLRLSPDVCVEDADGETVFSLSTMENEKHGFSSRVAQSCFDCILRLHPAIAALGADKHLVPMPGDMKGAFDVALARAKAVPCGVYGATLHQFLNVSPSFLALLPTSGADAKNVALALMLDRIDSGV